MPRKSLTKLVTVFFMNLYTGNHRKNRLHRNVLICLGIEEIAEEFERYDVPISVGMFKENSRIFNEEKH